jgi:hypothetical protein
MSRRSRNPFIKLTRFFKQDGSSRSTSNDDVTSAGLPPIIQPPRPPPPLPSDLSVQTSTEPSTSLQPPAHSSDCRMLTVSTRHCDASPRYSLVQPSNPSLNAPSAQLPATRSSTPHVGESGGFAGAHDFQINNPQFNDFSQAGTGKPNFSYLLLKGSHIINRYRETSQTFNA